MRLRSKCGIDGAAAIRALCRAGSTQRLANRRSTSFDDAFAPTPNSGRRQPAIRRSSSACCRRSARTTATARSGGPTFCLIPVRFTRSSRTPQESSARATRDKRTPTPVMSAKAGMTATLRCFDCARRNNAFALRLKTPQRGAEAKQRRGRRAPGVRSRERAFRGRAILSEAAIDVLVSFPQRRLLHLAHCIARQKIDEDDLFGRLEFGQAAPERRENC